jgi:hypothetical protein
VRNILSATFYLASLTGVTALEDLIFDKIILKWMLMK